MEKKIENLFFFYGNLILHVFATKFKLIIFAIHNAFTICKKI